MLFDLQLMFDWFLIDCNLIEIMIVNTMQINKYCFLQFKKFICNAGLTPKLQMKTWKLTEWAVREVIKNWQNGIYATPTTWLITMPGGCQRVRERMMGDSCWSINLNHKLSNISLESQMYIWIWHAFRMAKRGWYSNV